MKNINELNQTFNKKYSKQAKFLRMLLMDFYRPVIKKRKNKGLNQDRILYVMLILFFTSVSMQYSGYENYHIPFLSGWVFVLFTLIYLRFFPLTWSEMLWYERDAIRGLYNIPADWEPSDDLGEK